MSAFINHIEKYDSQNKLSQIYDLVKRTIGNELSEAFRFEFIDYENDKDVFELESKFNYINIKGSSNTALASGFNYYLKEFCKVHFSWCGNQMRFPEPLPRVEKIVRKTTLYSYRYYLNYCTYSYSMAFWDWERWEKEIDWMAMNGINLVLSTIGQEEVWRQFLLKLGYGKQEISEFICGPAYFPWQWMQNMTSWGGTLPEWWFAERVSLANKIHERMLSLGIAPVLQGYSGMVPSDFKLKYPDAKVIDQKLWCGFKRPSVLSPDDPLYSNAASIFYEEQSNLFGGNIHFYCVDPFHEGGNTEGINLTRCAEIIRKKMLEHDKNAVWVMQSWQDNPKKELLDGLEKSNILVLDLWCESKPVWKENNGFHGAPWLWCMIQNFGGKNGLFGNMDIISREPVAAMKNPNSGKMAGIGLAMEGIGTNPVMYELLTDMTWRNEAPDVSQWLFKYIERRYGKAHSKAVEGWKYLKESVYNCCTEQQGAMESIICARPEMKIENVSEWGPKEYYYDKSFVKKASILLFQGYEELSYSDAFMYDIVDITRQALADTARDYYSNLIDTYNCRNLSEFNIWADRFLELILDQDKLLGTRKEFLLGAWLKDARNLGRTESEKELFEFNARTLITLWGNEEASESLHEYSHREWAGLIRDFYYPRWEMYISSLRKALKNNENPQEINWYTWEYAWTKKGNDFSENPKGDTFKIIENIISKYYKLTECGL